MIIKNRISIMSIILATLATVPIVYTQNTLLRSENPTAISISAPADETAQATLVVRETSFEMADCPQSICQQYLKDLMTVEGADEIDINDVG